jgi:hypothetical protein
MADYKFFQKTDVLPCCRDILLKLRLKYFKYFLGILQEKNGEKWKKKGSYICIEEF